MKINHSTSVEVRRASQSHHTPHAFRAQSGPEIRTIAPNRTAWATHPPTVHLTAGVHEGPIVLDHSQILVGERGAVVRGGIVITSSDVTVRGVKVVGGEHGIDIDGGHGGLTGVVLEDVHVVGAELDGIHVRRGQVEVRDCSVESIGNEYGQGIDISFAADLPPSVVERCFFSGGQEGIFVDSALALVRDNAVRGTTLRGITITEMSMGSVSRNRVEDSIGIGILCSDYSHCEIEQNSILDTRADSASDNRMRQGYGIVANFGAQVQLRENTTDRSSGGVAAFAEATIEER